MTSGRKLKARNEESTGPKRLGRYLSVRGAPSTSIKNTSANTWHTNVCLFSYGRPFIFDRDVRLFAWYDWVVTGTSPRHVCASRSIQKLSTWGCGTDPSTLCGNARVRKGHLSRPIGTCVYVRGTPGWSRADVKRSRGSVGHITRVRYVEYAISALEQR